MQKRIHIFSLVTLAAILLCGGVSHAQSPTEEELSMQRIQDRMNSIEKSMSTMQQEVYRNSKGSKSKPPISDEPVGLDEEKSRAMNGKFEELEHSINTLAAKLDKIIADIDLRIATLEKNANANAVNSANNANAANTNAAASDNKPADNTNQVKPVDTTPTAKAESPSAPNQPSQPAPAKTDAAAQYDKAFEFLRLAKYPEAEHAFKDFIANNKGNDLLGNAYYWLGETFYTRENYQQAAVNFLKGYQDYPKGNKAPDNLLKLAMSLRSLKKEKEACATLDKMKKEYPSIDKDLQAKANAERTGLKCK